MKRLTLTDLRKKLAEHSKMMQPMLSVIERSQIFDFGTIETSNIADKELTLELWYRGMLRLPFDHTVFTFRRYGVRFYFCAHADVQVVFEKDVIDTGVTGFAVLTQHGDGFNELRADSFCWFKVPDETHILAGTNELEKVDNETPESFKEFTLSCIATMLSLCMMLNVKGVTKRHEPVPVRLNKKRERSGKPALSAITYVDLSHIAAHVKGGSGHSSSKSMHLRRGHIRHFDDGGVTWVRDCIVKADGDLKMRQRYQVSALPKGESHG